MCVHTRCAFAACADVDTPAKTWCRMLAHICILCVYMHVRVFVCVFMRLCVCFCHMHICVTSKRDRNQVVARQELKDDLYHLGVCACSFFLFPSPPPLPLPVCLSVSVSASVSVSVSVSVSLLLCFLFVCATEREGARAHAGRAFSSDVHCRLVVIPYACTNLHTRAACAHMCMHMGDINANVHWLYTHQRVYMCMRCMCFHPHRRHRRQVAHHSRP